MTEQIPGPRGLPLVGNLLDVHSPEGYLKATERLAEIYGPIFQITLQGKQIIICSSAELLMEVLDDKKFVTLPLEEMSEGDEAKGLFNAPGDHPDWGQGRRILNPSFGRLAVEPMFEGMRDIANQMCMKWARMGNNHQVLLTDDFTRLTLDIIALCTMDYRFNSFYQEKMHPFVDAMVTYLSTAGELSSRPWIMKKLFPSLNHEKSKAKKLLEDVGQAIIDSRRKEPNPGNDLLNVMLFKEDPKTGEVMRDSLIREQMIAFLVAGHETTSSLLSFVISHLLQHPRVFLKARQEVDEVLGDGTVEVAHLRKLKYIDAILRETLRITPTIPSLSRIIHPDRRHEFITLGGKYRVDPNSGVEVILTKAQTDPAYFGDDAHEFKPERMTEENPQFAAFNKAWKPFGNGARACIGQSFAWQEAIMVLAMILQNFDLNFSDPAYQMRIAEVMTIKPDNLYVNVRLRKGIDISVLEKRISGTTPEKSKSETQPGLGNIDQDAEAALAVLFGSNTGSCQNVAQKLASKISSSFQIKVAIQDLDSVTNSIPGCPIIIVTATYEGQPADNAGRFVAWLEDLQGTKLHGVKYAVFGLGDKNWQTTFQRIPKLIDSKLEENGAERLLPFSSVDVSVSGIMDELDEWNDKHLEGVLKGIFGSDKFRDYTSQTDVDAEISTDQRATSISNGMVVGKVLRNEVLTQSGQPEKKHMEIQLPQTSKYECGDYLAVLPLNSKKLVQRIMAHWDLPWDSTIVLKSNSFAPLLTNVPLSIFEILTGYYELSQPPNKKTLETCIMHTSDQPTLGKLTSHVKDSEAYKSAIKSSQQSLFDLLVVNPTIKLPFATYLSLLMPLRPRQYSISSSPITNPGTCTLTYGVLRASPSDLALPPFHGVASNYLSDLSPGDTLQVSVRRTATANKPCPFRLPPDSTSTPLLMIAAGTGLAPFRGFIQSRAAVLEANPDAKLAPAVLFLGCRSATKDRLYADEMDRWQALGAVDIRYAFSQEQNKSEGCKYVTERMWADRARMMDVWEKGARIYVCGSRTLLEGVGEVMEKVIEDQVKAKGGDQVEFAKVLEEFEREAGMRAAWDVFD